MPREPLRILPWLTVRRRAQVARSSLAYHLVAGSSDVSGW